MKVADKLKHHAERLYHEWGGWVSDKSPHQLELSLEKN